MLKIVSVPDPILSKPTKPIAEINDKIKNLVFEMEETLVAQSDPLGVGLSANQVGVSLSVFIIRESPNSDTKVFINPEIILLKDNPSSKTKKAKKVNKEKLEGCLSIPHIWGPVTRHDKVYLKYQDLNGCIYKKWFSGFTAVIIQHEMDHLKGYVFTQRSIEQKAPLYKEVNGKLKVLQM